MGFFSEEMAPMLGTYEAEARELMGIFDDIVGRVEQSSSFDPSDVAELFRCAHTIKGSSAMMGLDDLSRLTHAVEDLFDLLRSNPSLEEGHVPDILDHLYSFGDFMRDELDRMDDPDFSPTDAGDLIAEIKAEAAQLAGSEEEDGDEGNDQASQTSEPEAATGASSSTVAPAGKEAPKAAPTKAAEQAGDGVAVKVSFKPDEAMVNARAMVIVRQLSSKVNIISYLPADLTDPESAKQIGAEGLLLTLAPDDVDTAKQFLAKNTAVRRISVIDTAAAPAASATAETKQTGAQANPSADKFVTLRWTAMRDLQDLTGDFLLEVARLKSLSAGLPDGSPVSPAISRVSRLVDDLVYRVNTMAMVSAQAMVPQLSRMVRDMCRQSGKRVSFEVHGGNIEVDRNLYNSIAEPLQHIIRNSIDHGIEPPEERLAAGKEARGTVTLTIESLGGFVAFRVADDGRGIDTDRILAKAEAKGLLDKPAEDYTHDEALHLVMKAGLSTSRTITQYSGRGVGMDVVNAVVRDFDGRIEIASELGHGTSISLFMPVAMTSMDCLGFRVGPYTCFLPLRNLDKIYAGSDGKALVHHEGDLSLLTTNKHEIPILDLHGMLGHPGEDQFWIACHSMENEFAISVDEVTGEFNCTNKQLPSCLDKPWQSTCAIRNAVIMDDGSVGFSMNAALLAGHAYGTSSGDWGPQETWESTGTVAVDKLLEQTEGLFVFMLGDASYGIPVERIERVMVMPSCAPVPHAMPHLMGLASHHNNVVSVFDLAASAGIDSSPNYLMVLVDGNSRGMGIAVTDAIGVRDLEMAELTDDQPEQQVLVGGLRTLATLTLAPKEPPITLIG